MFDRASQLLTRGVAAAKANDRAEAKFYLEWALRSDAQYDQKVEAWFWLSQVSDQPEEKRAYLEQVLAHQPNHPLARQQWAILNGRLKPEDIVNPDQLPSPPDTSVQRSQVKQIYCPNCSSRLVFTADGSHLHCEHCGYAEGISRPASTSVQVTLEKSEQDFLLTMVTAKGHVHPVALQTFDCQRCGHSFLVDAKTISISCAYCGSLYVVKEISLSARQLIPPQAVLPFEINSNEVEQQTRDWLRQKGMAGRVDVYGIYLPAWTFDLGGVLQWRGYIESRYERRPVSGEYGVQLDDLLVPAVRRPPAGFVEELPHFDLGHLLPYDARFLANWAAELYDLPVGDASLQARKKGLMQLRPRLEASFTDTVAGLQLITAGMVVESYKLILLPVWLANFSHQTRSISLLINGQNGNLHAYASKKPNTHPENWGKLVARLQKWLKDD